MHLTSEYVVSVSASEPSVDVVLVSEVVWEQLNPARGSNSPKSATLWGDRTGPGPSGFLLKPVDGFRSPPHIHTADYHGVVIDGAIHNADPDAMDQYLPPVSFWTQSGGGVHVTASKGNSLAYIEVEGAFDVLPPEKRANNTPKETVIPAASISWTDLPGNQVSPNGPKLAILWGDLLDDKESGTLIKLPSGFAGTMQSNDETVRAVVIQGNLSHQVKGETDLKTLPPGSYYSSRAQTKHEITCKEGEDCIIYIRSEGKYEISATPLIKEYPQ